MPTLPRLRHDPDDPRHLLYCAKQECWPKRPKFRLGHTEVDLELVTSETIMVLMPDRTRWDLTKGEVKSVECTNCGEKYYPQSNYDPL